MPFLGGVREAECGGGGGRGKGGCGISNLIPRGSGAQGGFHPEARGLAFYTPHASQSLAVVCRARGYGGAPMSPWWPTLSAVRKEPHPPWGRGLGRVPAAPSVR